MGRGTGSRFGSLGARLTGRGPSPEAPQGTEHDEAARRLSEGLPAEDPVTALVMRADIGAHQFVAGPRYSYDVDIAELPAVLLAASRVATDRGLELQVQIPGRCLSLTEANLDDRLKAIDGRPRIRLLSTGADRRLKTNVALELWKKASRAYRSLSDHTAVRLTIPDSPSPQAGPAPTEDGFEEPIDVVYTWVDASDPGWLALAAPYLDVEALDGDRYVQTDELRYSLRSLDTFAPWARRVFVLSNCAPPDWFAASERMRWVDHSEVADETILPLFNSGAIDTLLHRIPDLSEHFLYLNDDFMLWDSVTPTTFFTWDGRGISRMATNSSLIYLQQLVEAGEATPSQHSRVNAARLLRERHGIFPTQVHGHVPYALRRSVMQAMEREFAQEIAQTRAARLRSTSDVSFVAYLYHHFAYLSGSAVYAEAPSSFVTINNHMRPSLHRTLRHTPFVCFQDSRGSADDAAYQAYKLDTLEQALPIPSTAEG